MARDSKKNKKQDLMKLRLWQIQWVRDLFLLLTIFLIFWLGYAMRDITIPLLVALLLAYLFEPLISFLANHPKFPLGRIPVITSILTILVTVTLLVIAITIPVVISQTSSLVNDVQEGKLRTKLEQVAANYAPEDFKDEIAETISYLPSSSESNQGHSKELLSKTSTTGEGFINIAQKTGDVAFNVLGSIVRFGILAVLIPFYFFFFSLWFPDFVKFSKGLIPENNQSKIEGLIAKMDMAVAGFVRGRIVIAFIMSISLAIGWMLVGVPYAILLGLVVGIFCAVPFLGLIGIPLSVGLLFLEQLGIAEAERMAWWAIVVWPILIFAIVQALDGWLLTPMIAGKATNLDPVTIFVAVIAGGSVLGAYGMLIAIPVAACIKIMLQEILLPNMRAWARGEVDDPFPLDD